MPITVTTSRTVISEDAAPTLVLRAYLAGLGVAATVIVSATVLASLGFRLVFG